MTKSKTIIVEPNSTANLSIVQNDAVSSDIKLKKKVQDIAQEYSRGKKQEARIKAQKLNLKHPKSIAVMQLLSFILYSDLRYEEACALVEFILQKTPNDSVRINFYGMILKSLQRFDEAKTAFEKAIEISPDFAEPYNGLGTVYRYHGEKEKAVKQFKKALEIEPDLLSAKYNLGVMKGYKFSEKEIDSVKKQLNNLDYFDDKARCCFTLYNALTKNKNYLEAFEWLNHANEIMFNNNNIKPNLPEFSKNIIKGFDKNYNNKLKKFGPSIQKPIFIIGMPRSGSTLLEQILCSHSEVGGIGESHEMPKLMTSIYAYAEMNVEMYLREYLLKDEKSLYLLRKKYATDAIKKIKHKKYYVDKMLNNFKFVGFIKNLIPDAKFIYIKRNPLDTCLSCYEKKFVGHEYAYDFIALADNYIAMSKLVAHWVKLFPTDIYQINYEDLVVDTASQVEKCLSFIGLEMQDSCLKHYENVEAVVTASTDQVREKINSNSIGKWKRYEQQLAPLIQRFSEAGININES